MGTAPIGTLRLLISLLVVVGLEIAAAGLGRWLHLPWIGLIAATRVVQTVAAIVIVLAHGGQLAWIGLDRRNVGGGLRIGLFWSVGFAVIAGLALAGVWIAGFDALALIRQPLPSSPTQLALFFLVGGLLAPIAEEIVFRGILFSYLRRWGLAAAVLISTALFAAFHLSVALPITQIVGGVVFALAYHTSGSLLAPILIHMLGNLAIFSLSLLPG